MEKVMVYVVGIDNIGWGGGGSFNWISIILEANQNKVLNRIPPPPGVNNSLLDTDQCMG